MFKRLLILCVPHYSIIGQVLQQMRNVLSEIIMWTFVLQIIYVLLKHLVVKTPSITSKAQKYNSEMTLLTVAKGISIYLRTHITQDRNSETHKQSKTIQTLKAFQKLNFNLLTNKRQVK